MKTTTDSLVRTYTSPVEKDQFTKDRVNFKGSVYAVRVGNEVQVKQIFASVGSVFEFLASLLLNSKNTFLGSKSINKVVNELSATTAKTYQVATPITQPPPPAFASTQPTQMPDVATNAQVVLSAETEELQFKEKYYSFMDQSIPFLDGWLSNLKKLREGADTEMLRYIKGEVKGLKDMIARKEKEAKAFASFKNNPGYQEAIATIRDSFKILKNELEVFANQLVPDKRLKTQNTTPTTAVPGIQNAGNSCYMNSALQGLLASPLVIDRIQKYNKNPIPNHERFMPTLKEFVIAYQNKNSNAIGECASKLRSELYHTRLKNLDVEDVMAMADADLIVMVLGETLELEYPLVTRRTAQSAIAVDGTVINEPFVSNVSSNQLLWNECKTSGGKDELSLQERFNQDCVEAIKESNLGWKQQTADGVPVTINEASTAYRIEGSPPPILVFKVGKSQGAGRDAPFTPYDVQPRDEVLDASKAFDTPPEGGAKYRLISVLVNHGRYHWTAITRRDDGWYNCNDSVVNYIGKELPQADAAVMIYELL